MLDLTCSSRADGPSLDVIWVRPNQITECTFVGDLLCACYHANLVQGPNLRTQATMDTQYLAVDYGAQCHEIEDLTACLPH